MGKVYNLSGRQGVSTSRKYTSNVVVFELAFVQNQPLTSLWLVDAHPDATEASPPLAMGTIIY